VSLSSLEKAIAPGTRVLLDSSALIAYFDGSEPASPVAKHVIDSFVRTGRNEAIVSMVTVMEVLIRPLMRSPVDFGHVMDFLTHFPHLRAQPIDLTVAQEAASVRATQRLRPADALVVATGLVTQVGLLVANDDRWKPIGDTRVRVLYLEDHLPFP